MVKHKLNTQLVTCREEHLLKERRSENYTALMITTRSGYLPNLKALILVINNTVIFGARGV